MKNLVSLAFACLLLFSCKTLQLSESRNTSNVKSIGVEWLINDDINPFYKERLDAEFEQEMAEFNAEKHAFTVHRKDRKDKDYITVDFTRGRLVSKGLKITGYAVTGIGLIATPILFLSQTPQSFAAFWYFPANKLNSTISLSPSLSASNTRSKKLFLETNTLFANTEKQGEKLVRGFGAAFHKILIKVDLALPERRP